MKITTFIYNLLLIILLLLFVPGQYAYGYLVGFILYLLLSFEDFCYHERLKEKEQEKERVSRETHSNSETIEMNRTGQH